MPTSLRDIPGAATRSPLLRERRRVRPRVPFRRAAPKVLASPPALARATPRRRHLFEHRRRPDVVNVLIAVLAVGLVLFFGRAAWDATRVDVEIEGIADGAFLTAAQAEQLAVRLTVDPDDRLDRAALTLDGRDVLDETTTEGNALRWAPESLRDGEHVLELTVTRPLLGPSRAKWQFTVDGRPPALAVPDVLDPAPIDRPVTVRGRVERGARLLVDGQAHEHDDGHFQLDFAFPPAAPIRIEAYDRAGNHSSADVIVPVERPSTRAVHVTAAAWNHDGLRAAILELIDAGRINAVELDLKDEGGKVGHVTRVPLAREIGASHNMYELRAVVDLLHGKGVRVIGRLVAFRDPVLVEAAWEDGRRDWVVQQPDGSPHPSYGGFANFAHPDVRRYNVALALEAARAGVDEILYDYVRRPEGPPEGMVVPGMQGSAEDVIVDFLADSHALLREAGVLQGASVFGIAADRPWTVGQDIPRMSLHSDYVSPMVYPSLFVKGEYRVPDPPRQPYEIVKRALEDFQSKMRGTGARLVPWLQSFSLGPEYGPDEVRRQIEATADLGLDSFLLWNPFARYSTESLDAVR